MADADCKRSPPVSPHLLGVRGRRRAAPAGRPTVLDSLRALAVCRTARASILRRDREWQVICVRRKPRRKRHGRPRLHGPRDGSRAPRQQLRCAGAHRHRRVRRRPAPRHGPSEPAHVHGAPGSVGRLGAAQPSGGPFGTTERPGAEPGYGSPGARRRAGDTIEADGAAATRRTPAGITPARVAAARTRVRETRRRETTQRPTPHHDGGR